VALFEISENELTFGIKDVVQVRDAGFYLYCKYLGESTDSALLRLGCLAIGLRFLAGEFFYGQFFFLTYDKI
jgi:hypothetical protein